MSEPAVAPGRNVRDARLHAGLTQEEVAERAGLSVRAISNLERGLVGRPRRSSLEAIADAVGLTEPERALLTRRPVEPTPPTVPVPVPTAAPPPAQLPASGPVLAGRQEHLAALDAVLARAGPRVAAIHGGAGMGKTTLALSWAGRVRAAFPDGQLYANLRGYAATEPTSPSVVLHQFLRALHVPVEQIPGELDARAALFRTVTTGRLLLVVLDDARDAEQVWPLLPAEPGCLSLVTSRATLGALSVRVGAVPVAVGPLAEPDAAGLLTAAVGAQRFGADRAAAAEVLARCAGSPLAITVVGQRAAATPELDLAQVAAELRESEPALLGLDLEPGDESCSVRTALSWSYSALPDEQARAFRLLTVHPGRTIGLAAAAAVLGIGVTAARRALAALAAVHLADRLPGDRWRQHDLLRHYATELRVRGQDRETGPARERLFTHYLLETDRATGTLAPHERARRPLLPGRHRHPAELASTDAARSWLADELPSVVAVCELSADLGRGDVALRLSNDLWSHLHHDALLDAALQVHGHAVRACRAAGDRAGECHALNNLGVAQQRLGAFAAAESSLRTALEQAHELDDDLLLGRALCNLGELDMVRNRPDDALRHLLGHLAIVERGDNPLRLASGLLALAQLHQRAGRHHEACDQYRRTLLVSTSPDCAAARGFAHVGLGASLLRLADDTAAELHHRAALDLAEREANPTLEYSARAGLGELLLARGQPIAASLHLERALELASAARERPNLLRAHALLGTASGQRGDTADEYRNWAAVRDLSRELQVDEHSVRQQMADLVAGGSS